MFLDLDVKPDGSPRSTMIQSMKAAGVPVPGIQYLFAFKPSIGASLSAFTNDVMRGPSPLTPAFRELIAAYTSRLNQCLF